MAAEKAKMLAQIFINFSIIRDFPKRNSLMGSFPLSFASFTVEIIDYKTLALKFFMVVEFETVQSLTSIEI